jgi:hypothetical protein
MKDPSLAETHRMKSLRFMSHLTMEHWSIFAPYPGPIQCRKGFSRLRTESSALNPLNLNYLLQKLSIHQITYCALKFFLFGH